MIPAVPASLQCVVADSGKLQSPDTHGDAARVTRANSFMYRQKPRLYTHQNWGFSCLAAITAPGGDDGRITGHWPNVTNIKHQHVTLSQPRLLQIAGLFYCLSIDSSLLRSSCLFTTGAWLGRLQSRAGSSFPRTVPASSLQSLASVPACPGLTFSMSTRL